MEHTEHSSGGQRERERQRQTEREKERRGGFQIKEERQGGKLRDIVVFASPCFLSFFIADCLVGGDVLHRCLRYFSLSVFLLVLLPFSKKMSLCMKTKKP